MVTSIPVAAFPSKRTVTGWPGSQTTGVTAAAKPPPHSFNSSSFAPAHGSPTRSRGLSGTVPFALIWNVNPGPAVPSSRKAAEVAVDEKSVACHTPLTAVGVPNSTITA